MMQQNYINPDEALFDSANRPRDQYGFLIRPGQQIEKWDWRGSMKNTCLENCSIPGFLKFQFDGSRSKDAIKIPLIEKIDKSELDFEWMGGNLSKVNNIEKYFIKQQNGKSSWRIQDGLLVIPESGSYIIDYIVEFYHQPSWSLGKMAKLYTELTLYDERGSLVGELDRSAKYTITAPDYLGGTTMQSLKRGMKLGISCRQKAKNNCVIRGMINIVKLS